MADTLFEREYEREMETWLRRRLRALGVLLIMVALAVPTLFALAEPADRDALPLVVRASTTLLWVLVIVWFAFVRSRPGAERKVLLRNATLMILLLGMIEALAWLAYGSLTAAAPVPLLLTLFILHLSACLFLPWTARESLLPFVGLFVLWGVFALMMRPELPWWDRVFSVIFAPAIFLPGLSICAMRLQRHSREFRTRFMGRHFTAMRREFNRARTIHQSLFPDPYDDGFVSFNYSYVPMAELGGDFVHLSVGAEGLLYLTVIDVTGHGLAAALTVNRLYGELERIRGESPHADPGEVLTLLNRYVHLTLSRHNVFATAICARVDPYLGRLAWASGGHHPAILRESDGSLRELGSTAMVLGALDVDEFDAGQEEIELNPNDVVLLYTDGAVEARDRDGMPFGLERVRELLLSTPAPRNWPQFIASSVNKHHGGRAEDDVLIASLTIRALRLEPQYDDAVAARHA